VSASWAAERTVVLLIGSAVAERFRVRLRVVPGLEKVVPAFADLQDIATLHFPGTVRDPRTKRMNTAHLVLDRLAGEICAARFDT
jgi:hypothetical protein